MKTFLICALEPSANLHLKFMLKEYLAKYGKFELVGIFDSILCAEFNLKNKPLFDSHEFSAMGFVEVLPLIFKAKRAIKILVNLVLESEKSPSNTHLQGSNAKSLNKNHSQISSDNDKNMGDNFSTNHAQISAILCIDSPAFNIPFAKALKKAGSKTRRIYYILPQVWAWKKGRVPVIEEHFDTLCSILPFDTQFFSKSVYLGHPLLDELSDFKDESELLKISKKSENDKIIAFLPGSRRSEIKRLMPIFRDLATRLGGEKILCIPPFNENKIDEIYGDTQGFKLEYNTPKLLRKADFAFICSGTATLEAALVGTPFVLAYKAKKIDIFIAKLFVKLKHIGLANIMCDFATRKPLHTELLQDEVSVENLLKAYEGFDYEDFAKNASFLKSYLKHGSGAKLAEILAK